MEYITREIYDRYYDNRLNRSKAKFIGKFQVIEEIKSDGWDEIFIGLNMDTEEVCLIEGREVCCFESGTAYTVYPLKYICVKNKMKG